MANIVPAKTWRLSWRGVALFAVVLWALFTLLTGLFLLNRTKNLDILSYAIAITFVQVVAGLLLWSLIATKHSAKARRNTALLTIAVSSPFGITAVLTGTLTVVVWAFLSGCWEIATHRTAHKTG